MAQGGFRPNSGRKSGAKNALTLLSVQKAREEGILPHEWLLKVTRGEPIKHTVTNRETDKDGVEKIVHEEIDVYPDFETRVDAAKACCQFYAPRLSAIQVKSINPKGVVSTVDEHDLNEMLEELANDIREKKRKGGV